MDEGGEEEEEEEGEKEGGSGGGKRGTRGEEDHVEGETCLDAWGMLWKGEHRGSGGHLWEPPGSLMG